MKECGCGETIDYLKEYANDVLKHGFSDHEIRREVLGSSNQEMTMEETLRMVEAKEAGKRSEARLNSRQLNPHQVVEAMGSTYKRGKSPSTKAPYVKDDDSCTYCGSKGHGKSASARIRRSDCPAFGVRCHWKK